MPVVVIANPKGGVGKSTLASTVAGYWASRGHAVMLGDVDRQQSARLWLSLRPEAAAPIATWDVLHRIPHDWKVVIVGDATMSPYEIAMPGGSVEHWNEEAGAVWLQRLNEIYDKVVWLNPTPERFWNYTQSVQMVKELLGDRMFPLTIEGLDKAMKELGR